MITIKVENTAIITQTKKRIDSIIKSGETLYLLQTLEHKGSIFSRLYEVYWDWMGEMVAKNDLGVVWEAKATEANHILITHDKAFFKITH